MAFTLVVPTTNESIVHGGWTDRKSFGGFPIEDEMGYIWRMFNVDLELTAYVTGGVPIPKEITGLQRVCDMYVMAGRDPYGTAEATPPDGLTFMLDRTDPEAPLLLIHDVGGEVLNASTQSGASVWLLMGGID